MQITHLSLTNFRNFARLDIDIPGGSVLLVGGNAQGKTSLLEAIYYLATFVSFHASNEKQLINFGASQETLAVTRIVGEFTTTSDRSPNGVNQRSPVKHRLEVRLIQETNGYGSQPRLRKEIILDGVKNKIGDVIGAFNAVLFLPQMMRVVEGSPEERRRYLNLAMAQTLPDYANSLADYSRVLTQRNALLKQLNERGGDPGLLNYWDQQLAEYGARVIYGRIHTILELEKYASRAHSKLTHGHEILRLVYEPSFDPLPQPKAQFQLPMNAPIDRSGLTQDRIRQGYMERLQQVRNEDTLRGVTTVGPHRDEVRFLGNGVDLGIYGSRGQARTAVLSLKLAEVSWMHDRTGEWPVLLLDEVLAELDPERRSDLLERLSKSEQSLLTTTDLDLFSQDFIRQAKTWQILDGRVQS